MKGNPSQYIPPPASSGLRQTQGLVAPPYIEQPTKTHAPSSTLRKTTPATGIPAQKPSQPAQPAPLKIPPIIESLYIEPAQPPTRAYIPPPKVLKFDYNSEDCQKYANIYSLLVAIEGVEDQASNGVLSETDRDNLINTLTDQFNRATRVVRFTEQNVRDFAEECNLKCLFAFNYLYGKHQTHGRTDSLGHAYQLGSNLTSLDDLAAFPDATVDQYRNCLLSIRMNLRALADHDSKYANAVTAVDHWITVMRQATILSESDKQSIIELGRHIRTI